MKKPAYSNYWFVFQILKDHLCSLLSKVLVALLESSVISTSQASCSSRPAQSTCPVCQGCKASSSSWDWEAEQRQCHNPQRGKKPCPWRSSKHEWPGHGAQPSQAMKLALVEKRLNQKPPEILLAFASFSSWKVQGSRHNSISSCSLYTFKPTLSVKYNFFLFKDYLNIFWIAYKKISLDAGMFLCYLLTCRFWQAQKSHIPIKKHMSNKYFFGPLSCVRFWTIFLHLLFLQEL